MDAYTEPGKGIQEVVFEFYDNQGFAAALHSGNKNSYNGKFTEHIILNDTGKNYKLNNIDHENKVHYHRGLSISGENCESGKIYLNESGEVVN
jgi:hypothetical protein